MTLGPRHRGRAPDQGIPAAGTTSDGEPAKGETAIWHRGFGPRPGAAHRSRLAFAVSILGLVAVATAFAVVYGQLPLYTASQHSTLLPGLAQGGVGLLEADWQAATTDPAPVASLLVAAVARLEAEWLLLLFHAILIGAYGVALFGIGTTMFRLRGPAPRLALLAALLFVHSWLAGELRAGLPDDLRSLVSEGLAGQGAPGPGFEPTLFGVLLVVSLLLYARGRLIAAVATAAAAAILAPVYLLGALVLSGAYLADTFFNTGARTAVVRGAAVAAAALLPVALYSLIAFAPASPALHEAAQSVLVDFRLADRAKPEVWFGADDAVRLGIVVAGLMLAWRSALFPVLALAVAASAVLTALQLVTGSDALALLFPWRLSVFLVPVSAAIVLAAAASALFALARAGERVVARFGDRPSARLVTVARTGAYLLAGLVIAVSLVIGGDRIGRLEPEPRGSPIGELIAAERRPGDLYLVPPRAGELRIDGGVPVYVDYRGHPYADREVLEWRRRLREAERIYADGSLRCRPLAALAGEGRITHVAVRSPTRARCDFIERRYSAGRWSVFTVAAQRAEGTREGPRGPAHGSQD